MTTPLDEKLETALTTDIVKRIIASGYSGFRLDVDAYRKNIWHVIERMDAEGLTDWTDHIRAAWLMSWVEDTLAADPAPEIDDLVAEIVAFAVVRA